MKKVIVFVLELSIIAAIMFAFVFMAIAIKSSDKDMAIIAILSGVAAVILHSVHKSTSLHHDINREQMKVDGKLR